MALLIVGLTLPFLSCSSIPKGVKAVDNFEKDKYLGKWYEIARFDFRFERNLNNTTANYSLNENGTIKVVNKGYNYIKKEWTEAKAKAIIAALKTKTPAQVQQENDIKLQDLGEITRMSGAPLELERAAFTVAKPTNDHWSAGYYMQGNNLIIVAVSNVTAGDPASINAEQRQQLTPPVAHQTSGRDYQNPAQ